MDVSFTFMGLRLHYIAIDEERFLWQLRVKLKQHLIGLFSFWCKNFDVLSVNSSSSSSMIIFTMHMKACSNFRYHFLPGHWFWNIYNENSSKHKLLHFESLYLAVIIGLCIPSATVRIKVSFLKYIWGETTICI